jgi:putative MATE family efflux protein
MGEMSIRPLLWKFSLPAIAGMMVAGLYNIVDRIFIGLGVGALGLAGATVSFPVMLVQMAFGMLIGLGATALISIQLGKKQSAEAERIVGCALFLLIASSLLLSAAGLFFLRPLLSLFGGSEEVMPYAVAYLRWILIGGVFQAISFGMNSIIRSEGNPRMAMKTMFIGAGLNALLNPLLIFVFHFGVAGSAIATVISQAVSAPWVLRYFTSGNSHLRLQWPNVRFRLQLTLRIMTLGSAPFTMQIVASVLNALLNNQLQKYGGDLAISSIGILYGISMLLLMPIFGINQGSQPIIGYNFGAQKFSRVKQTLQYALIAASAVVVTGFVIINLFPHMLIALFNHDNPVLKETAERALHLYFLMLPVLGFQIVSASYFQAVGKPKRAMLLTLSRQVIFFIPAMFILPRFYGLDGVWLSAPFADFFSASLTALFLWHEIHLLNQPALKPAP